MASDTLEREVIQFLAEFCCVKPGRITTRTTVFGNLGMDGDDALELLEAFAERFQVDMQGIDCGRHFGPEGVTVHTPRRNRTLARAG